MDSVEDYVRQWVKHEKEDLDTLSKWVKGEVADTNYNLKTQWVYEHSLYIKL